jgi:hypothetical protein
MARAVGLSENHWSKSSFRLEQSFIRESKESTAFSIAGLRSSSSATWRVSQLSVPTAARQVSVHSTVGCYWVKKRRSAEAAKARAVARFAELKPNVAPPPAVTQLSPTQSPIHFGCVSSYHGAALSGNWARHRGLW